VRGLAITSLLVGDGVSPLAFEGGAQRAERIRQPRLVALDECWPVRVT
jgi:hypothetical protein